MEYSKIAVSIPFGAVAAAAGAATETTIIVVAVQ